MISKASREVINNPTDADWITVKLKNGRTISCPVYRLPDFVQRVGDDYEPALMAKLPSAKRSSEYEQRRLEMAQRKEQRRKVDEKRVVIVKDETPQRSVEARLDRIQSNALSSLAWLIVIITILALIAGAG